MIDYTDLPGLKGIYLADSYVLDIAETPEALSFTMEFVLTPEHPAYHITRIGEQYCYADGVLEFSDVTKLEWRERSTNRYIDASGETDLGNIDSLKFDGTTYYIEGDWGKVQVSSKFSPNVKLNP